MRVRTLYARCAIWSSPCHYMELSMSLYGMGSYLGLEGLGGCRRGDALALLGGCRGRLHLAQQPQPLLAGQHLEPVVSRGDRQEGAVLVESHAGARLQWNSQRGTHKHTQRGVNTGRLPMDSSKGHSDPARRDTLNPWVPC